MTLSMLCVTKGEPWAATFLEDLASLGARTGSEVVILRDGVDLHSKGYVESVLDEALARCTGDYVLRLDDDERCSDGMASWIASRGYESAMHWKFDRVHLWGDRQHAILTPQLFPDHQTRLSTRALAGGRRAIHSGSPSGGGTLAPCAVEHHKFIVKTLDERREIVKRYDSIQEGAGSRFLAFSCPEDFYTSQEIAASIADWDGYSLNRMAA